MTKSLWNTYDISCKSPEVPVNLSSKVVRKEKTLELNAPWDSMAMGWKIYDSVRPEYIFRLFTTGSEVCCGTGRLSRR